jgi:hypothetical protein
MSLRPAVAKGEGAGGSPFLDGVASLAMTAYRNDDFKTPFKYCFIL